ncbi:MATE efflux family protein [Artemisia annua]|uniref:MATE efflux family protein n=1 Tax=Artemisia annua TaxID=35608 RepID=A0A2U1N8E1_ARTAN|nr:MATE efflux family protein [Artemisia annua]
MKSGGFLLGRSLALHTTRTLATSTAARQGPIAMAAHQRYLQVWLAVSLITYVLSSSGQALIASSVSKGDYRSVKDVAYLFFSSNSQVEKEHNKRNTPRSTSETDN